MSPFTFTVARSLKLPACTSETVPNGNVVAPQAALSVGAFSENMPLVVNT